MPPIATNSIWFENQLELLIRWFEKQPSRIQEQAASPSEALERCKRRAIRVLEYSKLTESKQLKTLREWETRWEGKAEWQRLKTYLNNNETDVVRHKDQGSFASLTSTALQNSDRESIIIVEDALKEICANAKEAGLSVPLTTNDMATIELAYETYHYLVSKMGNEARDWTEEIASHFFVQNLLGLPFNLLVLSFIDFSSETE